MAYNQMEMLEAEEDTQQGKYLTFAIGEEEYGLDIGQVTEIIGIQPVTALPEMPGYVKGVVNLRGKVFPVIDMRLRFNKPQREYDERTCIIVVDIQGVTMGLIVDRVLEVIKLDDADIAPPPDARTGILNRYLKGIGKSGEGVKLLIDAQTLFVEEELDRISQC